MPRVLPDYCWVAGNCRVGGRTSSQIIWPVRLPGCRVLRFCLVLPGCWVAGFAADLLSRRVCCRFAAGLGCRVAGSRAQDWRLHVDVRQHAQHARSLYSRRVEEATPSSIVDRCYRVRTRCFCFCVFCVVKSQALYLLYCLTLLRAYHVSTHTRENCMALEYAICVHTV